MVQYTEYGSVPQAVRDLIANKCQLLDQYILMQTGQNEYTALVRNPVTDDTVQYKVYRGTNYNTWTLTQTVGQWDYSVTNEYYVYSNIGLGSALTLPVVNGIQAHASAVLVCVLMLAIFFKGVLFPCLDRVRRRRR